MLDYLKDKTICTNQFLITIVWIVGATSTFTLGIHLKHMPGNFEWNAQAVAIASAVGPIVAWVVLRYFRAKNVFSYAYGVAAAGFLTIVSLYNEDTPQEEAEVGVMLLIIVVFVSLLIGMTSVYRTHPMMFPTLFVATSIGISNLIAKSCVMAAPQMAELDYPTPLIIVGIGNAVAAIASAFIIEPKFEQDKL